MYVGSSFGKWIARSCIWCQPIYAAMVCYLQSKHRTWYSESLFAVTYLVESLVKFNILAVISTITCDYTLFVCWNYNNRCQ